MMITNPGVSAFIYNHSHFQADLYPSNVVCEGRNLYTNPNESYFLSIYCRDNIYFLFNSECLNRIRIVCLITVLALNYIKLGVVHSNFYQHSVAE